MLGESSNRLETCQGNSEFSKIKFSAGVATEAQRHKGVKFNDASVHSALHKESRDSETPLGHGPLCEAPQQTSAVPSVDEAAPRTKLQILAQQGPVDVFLVRVDHRIPIGHVDVKRHDFSLSRNPSDVMRRQAIPN